MTDTIADMLTRIRNAGMSRKQTVILPYSKVKWTIANILLKEGYVSDIEKIDSTPKTIRVTLKYAGEDKTPHIKKLTRISKPGRRVYVNADEIPMVLNGLGIAIMSTSSGLMTNRAARTKRIGGEVICEIY